NRLVALTKRTLWVSLAIGRFLATATSFMAILQVRFPGVRFAHPRPQAARPPVHRARRKSLLPRPAPATLSYVYVNVNYGRRALYSGGYSSADSRRSGSPAARPYTERDIHDAQTALAGDDRRRLLGLGLLLPLSVCRGDTVASGAIRPLVGSRLRR